VQRHHCSNAEGRLRQPRLPQGTDRFRADPDAALGRGLPDRQDLRGRGPGHRQHLRLHRRCGQGKPGHHRRSTGRQRQGDRHGLPGRALRRRGRQPGAADASFGAGGDRPARHAGSDGCRARPPAQAARPLHRPGAGGGHQAHAEALRLPEDQRGLQPPLHLLHHPLDARRSRQPADRRRPEGGTRAVRRRRQGTAGHQPGHLGLRGGHPIPHRLLRRQAGQDAHAGAGAGAGRAGRAARRLGPAALRVPVPVGRRGHPADGHRQGPALPGRALPAQPPRRAAAHEAAGQRRAQPGAHPALARGLPGAGDPQHLHRRLPRRNRGRVLAPAGLRARGADRPRRLLRLQLGGGRRRQRDPGHAADRSARGAPRPVHGGGGAGLHRAAAAARRRHHAGAGRFRTGAGTQGRSGAQLRRCPGNRRHGAAAASGKTEQAVEGRRIHPRTHRGGRRPRPGGPAGL
ncbi:MAG: Ribosomal protein S12p Asp88 (E. coli) methylthiotransferase, partial [uncultured Ramlibacter sp.]